LRCREFGLLLISNTGGVNMDELKSILVEIREMLKVLSDRQEYIMKNIDELKEQNKKLSEEVKINSFVLNNITPRNEIIN
jgi:hypothetical protein